jgi:hypothetical protein
MKRTRQVFHREGDEVPKFVSGCRQFEGEDIRKFIFEMSEKLMLSYRLQRENVGKR